MKAVTEDIKEILELNADLGLHFSKNLFIAIEPSQPDNCVTLYDTPSVEETTLTTQPYQYMSCQIRIRHKSYVSGMQLAWDIVEHLKTFVGYLALSGFTYTNIRCTTLPFHLGADDNNRQIIIINIETQRR